MSAWCDGLELLGEDPPTLERSVITLVAVAGTSVRAADGSKAHCGPVLMRRFRHSRHSPRGARHGAQLFHRGRHRQGSSTSELGRAPPRLSSGHSANAWSRPATALWSTWWWIAPAVAAASSITSSAIRPWHGHRPGRRPRACTDDAERSTTAGSWYEAEAGPEQVEASLLPPRHAAVPTSRLPMPPRASDRCRRGHRVQSRRRAGRGGQRRRLARSASMPATFSSASRLASISLRGGRGCGATARVFRKIEVKRAPCSPSSAITANASSTAIIASPTRPA